MWEAVACHGIERVNLHYHLPVHEVSNPHPQSNQYMPKCNKYNNMPKCTCNNKHENYLTFKWKIIFLDHFKVNLYIVYKLHFGHLYSNNKCPSVQLREDKKIIYKMLNIIPVKVLTLMLAFFWVLCSETKRNNANITCPICHINF